MDQLGRWLVAISHFLRRLLRPSAWPYVLFLVGPLRRDYWVRIYGAWIANLRLERELAQERAVRWRQFSKRLKAQAKRDDGDIARPPKSSHLTTAADIGRIQI
jgi:hypothetical protein